MNAFLAFLAFAVFTAFAAILAFELPSPDLVVIILLTLALVAYDFITTIFDRRD